MIQLYALVEIFIKKLMKIFITNILADQPITIPFSYYWVKLMSDLQAVGCIFCYRLQFGIAF